jgi:hypothetical protein
MYGDPTLKLEFTPSVEAQVDELGQLLATVDLNRRSFESAAERVIEKAFEWGRPTGQLASAHLLAAMIGGDDSFLHDRLQEQLGREGPRRLFEAFEGMFRFAGQSAPAAGDCELSQHAEAMLRDAAGLVRERDAERGRINERDLVQAFVNVGGGASGEVLATLSVDVHSLAPYRQADTAIGEAQTTKSSRPVGSQEPAGTDRASAQQSATETLPTDLRFGPLDRDSCREDAWVALVGAGRAAWATGRSFIDTACLFDGLSGVRDGALPRALRRLGVRRVPHVARPQKKPEVQTAPPTLGPAMTEMGNIITELSKTVSQILVNAQANAAGAARDRVSDSDFLIGFVRLGGGETGRQLRRENLVLESLITTLFDEQGLLDRSRLDEKLLEAVDLALDCARRKGQEVVGRRHMLYGLLATPGGLLPSVLAEENLDAEQLSDRLYIALGSVGGAAPAAGGRMSDFSGGLLAVMSAAEENARSRRSPVVGEASLLRALLDDGGGAVGQWLVSMGVRLSRLRSDLERRI